MEKRKARLALQFIAMLEKENKKGKSARFRIPEELELSCQIRFPHR